MRRVGSLLLLLSALVLSCVSVPEAAEQAPPDPPEETVAPVPPPQPEPIITPAVPVEEKPEESVFDPASISQEKFDTTKAEVQALIEDLNGIIRARNFRTWTGYLAESYFMVISSETFLAEKTEELFKRDQIVAANLGRDPRMVVKKILKTPKDYFDNVVAPSRSNDHLSDIDFVSENRVKAYTLDNRGNRLVLYDLEVIDGTWKIVS